MSTQDNLVNNPANHKDKHVGPKPHSPRVKKRVAAVTHLDGKAGLYTMYRKHATVEDDHLIQKYSDDISGLLTFAGLLSAIITAFLFAEEVDFKLHSTATTNVLLYQILLEARSAKQPDAATLILPTDIFDTKEEDLETSSVILFHISLGLSLLSAFGGLASKQWIMHYGYFPTWANNDKKRARLRRMRHHGLKSWGFFIIMEAINLLLQLSLLIFSTGAFLASRQGGLVQTLAALSVIIGFLFYVTTLLLGALVPSAPFKSPLSQALFRLLFCTRNIHLLAYSFGYRVLSTLGFLRRHRILHARWQLLERWSEYRKLWGEESCLINEEVGAGIRWWGLSQGFEWSEKPVLAKEHSKLAELKLRRRRKMSEKDNEGHERLERDNEEHERLDSERASTFEKLVGNDPRLLEWGSQVIQRTMDDRSSPLEPFSEKSLKAQVEILCEVIYYVPVATQFLLEAGLCHAIRWAYDIEGANDLDISKMPDTTSIIYFRGLLCAGTRGKKLLTTSNASSKPQAKQGNENVGEGMEVDGNVEMCNGWFFGLPFGGARGNWLRNFISPSRVRTLPNPCEETMNGADTDKSANGHENWIHGTGRLPLCKEIKKFLDQYQFGPEIIKHKFLYQIVEDITSTIALASILISGEADAASADKRAKFAQCTPYKQLFHSWELLSTIQTAQPGEHEVLCDLMLACISTSAAVLCNSAVQFKFLEYAGLDNAHFRRCLHTLVQLSESGEDDQNREHPFRYRVAKFLQDLDGYKHRFSAYFRDHLRDLRQKKHLSGLLLHPAAHTCDSDHDKGVTPGNRDVPIHTKGTDAQSLRPLDLEQGIRSKLEDDHGTGPSIQ